MNCNELVELVTDYFERALSPSDRARFETHLEECPHCVEYLQQMRVTLETLGGIPPETIAPEVRERLLETFRDWKAQR